MRRLKQPRQQKQPKSWVTLSSLSKSKEPLRVRDLKETHLADDSSRESTAKRGNAFPYMLMASGTPASERQLSALGLVRWKAAPAPRKDRWTVHGAENFSNLAQMR